jgi:uncharacterized protein
MLALKPAHEVVRITNGAPWIAAFRCVDCGAVAAQQTLACRRCASRAPLQSFRASERGRVHSWSVVERSYPGVVVPFVSVIVDLSDGLTLKGTLRDVDVDAMAAGMSVALVFDDAGGACDANGALFVGYHFVPVSGDTNE